MKQIKLLFLLIVRSIRWLFFKLTSADNEIVATINGYRMILLTSKKGLDLKEESIFKQLLLDKKREFEATEIIKEIIKPGYRIFELGANIGYYALLESKLIGEKGIIYAIEPEQRNFNLLQRNIQANQITNIETFNMAISDRNAEAPFYITPYSNLHSMIKPKSGPYDTIMIKTQTVDDFLHDKGEINLIRMDIEGYEYNALKGMDKTLVNNRQLQLFIELHCNVLKPDQSIEILRKLKGYGFEIYKAVSRDTYIRKILGQTRVEKMSIDELCHDPRLLNMVNAFEIFFTKKGVL